MISLASIQRDQYIRFFDFIIRFIPFFHISYLHLTLGSNFGFIFYKHTDPLQLFQSSIGFNLFIFSFYTIILISFFFNRYRSLFFIPIYLMYAYLFHLNNSISWGWSINTNIFTSGEISCVSKVFALFQVNWLGWH